VSGIASAPSNAAADLYPRGLERSPAIRASITSGHPSGSLPVPQKGLEKLQVCNGRRTHSPGFEDRILLRQWMRKLGRTVAGLPANQRLVLNLSFVDGMSHSEIARAINRPLGTVKSWMRAALQVLRGQAAIERAGIS
jgi:DNA-directed RNA polymerase specialized sigma24 family protein